MKQANSVAEIFVDPVTTTIYHVEKRPGEGGRCTIVKTEDGTDLVGKEFNVRTGVHEVCICVVPLTDIVSFVFA